MPLPVNFDAVTVKGTYVNLDGTPAVGTITFTANVTPGTFLKDVGADVMILPMTLSAKLDGQGSFTIPLPATDDADVVPNGFTYAVKEQFGSGTRSYSIQVPVGTGPIDLISVAPAQPVTASVGLVQTSQIGQAGGVAGLDSAGDVTDAAGNKVLGSAAELARNPDTLITGGITRNPSGLVTTAAVAWPDGTTGTYTTDSINTQWLSIDGYHITYNGATTKTYTQPSVTRDGTGAVTDVPAIAVS